MACAHSARSATASAARGSAAGQRKRRAAGGRASRASSPSCVAIHNAPPASGSTCRGVPADQRPKTAAYPALDDPFAGPAVEGAEKILSAMRAGFGGHVEPKKQG